MRKKIFIVDTMAMIFRNFFGLVGTPLTTSSGLPVGAVLACANFLHKLIHDEQPDYLVAALESQKPTFRHEAYPEYKQNRHATPSHLQQQIPLVLEMIELMDIPILSAEGFEADDVIGSLVKHPATSKCSKFMVSADKDFLQLIDGKTFLYAPQKKGPPKVWDEAAVCKRFDCKPSQVIDLLAIIGDTSDNVPGVSGIGEKGARQLISTFDTLENLYANLEQVPSARHRQLLEAGREQAFASKQLVTIDTHIELNIDLERFVHDRFAQGAPALADFYERLEFKQLLKRLSKTLLPSSQPTVTSIAAEPSTPLDLKQILPAQTVAFHWRDDDHIDLATGDNVSWSCDAGHLPTEILQSENIVKVVHDLKSLLWQLAKVGKTIHPPVWDLKIAHYLLDPNDSEHSLEKCLQRGGVSDVATKRRADLMLTVQPALCKLLESHGMLPVFDTLELPLCFVLFRMEQHGIFCDRQILEDLSKRLSGEIDKISDQIYELAGENFNILSTKQLQHIIFDKLKIHSQLGIRRLKKTKTGFSTNEEVLTQLAEHPLPRLVLTYRSYTKLRSTYLDSLPQHIGDATGRIHAHFRQTVAATGRLSSDQPNLQNIPMRKEPGRTIRKAFRPAQSRWKIISADYSQIEIRLLAHLAEDEVLIHAFNSGFDIHATTASKIHDVDLDAVTPEQRNHSKVINFGILYGMGPQRLAKEAGISVPQAKDFIERYFDSFPKIRDFTESLVQLAKERGYSETIVGRRRPIPHLGESNPMLAARAVNIAINSPIQGSAADLIKMAMLSIDKDLTSKNLQGRLLLQIHDELVYECPDEEVEAVSSIVRQRMTSAMRLKVPLEVSLGIGNDWFEAHG